MQSLIEFKEFVDEVQQNNSRNYKLEVLRKYKENENIKRYLDFIYNPYKITGISEGKLYKEVSMVVQGVTSMYELMDYLLVHNTGRDEDIAVIQQYKNTLDIDYYEIFDSVVTKSLSLGVDTLSINKCMGDLIPVFNVQLANKYFDKPEVVEGKTFALTTKIDGGRIIAIKENGKVTFYTRQGQLYEGLVDLEKEMLEKLPDNICLDGEITLLDKGSLTSKDQYKETMKITRKKGEKHGVKMLVFDCMRAEEFRNQKCETPYLERRNNMLHKFSELLSDCDISIKVNSGIESKDYYNGIIDLLNSKFTYFQILPYLYLGDDVNQINKWLNYNIDHGEEGVIR